MASRALPTSGMTLTIAKRAQERAVPDTVVISAGTHALVQGYFTYQALDEQLSKLTNPHGRSASARRYLDWVLSVHGYPDQALQRSREALVLARDLADPFSLAHTLTFVARVYQGRRELQATQECAQESVALCTEHGFAYLLACGMLLEGWVLAMQGEATQGITRMHQGLDAIRATETQLNLTYFLMLLAEAYVRDAQAQEGRTVVAEALGLAQNNGERCYEAELYRLKGVLRLALSSDHYVEAETYFCQALDIARHQQARSLELGAALSLSRLWQQQGKRQAAYEVLAPVCGIDILVNNAGGHNGFPFPEASEDIWLVDLEIKLYGAIRCCKAVIPYMW